MFCRLFIDALGPSQAQNKLKLTTGEHPPCFGFWPDQSQVASALTRHHACEVDQKEALDVA